MGVPTIKTGPMTVEEYFAFTDTRPDNEKLRSRRYELAGSPDSYHFAEGHNQEQSVRPGNTRRPSHVRNPVAFDCGARSTLEAYSLYEPAVAHALYRVAQDAVDVVSVRAQMPDLQSGTSGRWATARTAGARNFDAVSEIYRDTGLE